MTEKEFVTKLKTLKLDKDDIIIVDVPDRITIGEYERLKNTLMNA